MANAAKSRRVVDMSQTDGGPHCVDAREFTEIEEQRKQEEIEVQGANDLYENIDGM